MRHNIVTTFVVLLVSSITIYAQEKSGKILDRDTNSPIPYVNIKFNDHTGAISNEEGDFNLVFNQDTKDIDSIHFSSMGYATKSLTINEIKDTIYLNPEALELSSVYLTDEELSVDDIIDRVEDNISINYSTAYTTNRFFMRESFNQYYKRLNFGFKKSSIKEITKKLIDSMMSIIPQRTSYHNETLGDLHNKQFSDQHKLTIIKTSKLYNKSQEVSFESLQDKFMQVLNDNVKKDSYLKIKSGLFGTKVSVDSIVNTSENSDKIQHDYEQNNYFYSRKRAIGTLLSRVFFEDDSPINVIRKSSRYDFKLEDYTYIEGNFAYIISFTPGNFADIKGKLYINTEDFAVLRIDYQNSDAVYNKKFNMLGVNINHIGYKGTMIFSKGNQQKYRLKYISHENTNSFKLDRPLTVIEKNKHVKGRRKQNELKLQMQFNIVDKNKRELVVFDSKTTNNSAFKALKETKKVDVKYFSSYNKDFWKGYNIIEPNHAIKEFTNLN
ncbi:MAG: carboxypeptidase-like regulatory domain-containing protein [Flavobacteriaceae bacterium]